MFFPVGSSVAGASPLAGDPLWDPPTVTVVPPGTITTGGPKWDFQWVYSQPQGKAQERFRVRVREGSVYVFDTGWLGGSVQVFTVDFDASGVPHDASGLVVEVSVRGPEAIGVGDLKRYEASAQSTFNVQWGVPHCSITDPPDGTVWASPTGLTVHWVFSDDRAGKTQSAYRARLLLADSGTVEYDSGWVPSAANSHLFPVTLRNSSTYRVEVQLKNNHGIRSD